MKKFLPIFIFSLFVLSCTRTVYVPVQRPAQVYVDQSVQRLALIDRSETERNAVNITEGIITGTLPGLDEEASQAAMNGLASSLQEYQRFQVVRTSEQLKSPVTLPGQWPSILDWNHVEQLCRKYDVDGLLILEAFDSNFIVTDGSREVEKKEEGGRARKVREYYAEGVATVTLGFRFYHPASRTVIDEHRYSRNRKWEAKGNLLQLAMTNLIDHREAVMQVSAQSGSLYATRISPHWYRANRSFFTKGKKDANFDIGVRRATVNDWTGAMEAWQRSALSSKRKTAGRSYYNLALMYEIQGDLETALTHAQKAYTDYGIKQARSYSNILRRRIQDAEWLD
jgi:hypothetical protein